MDARNTELAELYVDQYSCTPDKDYLYHLVRDNAGERPLNPPPPEIAQQRTMVGPILAVRYKCTWYPVYC